MEEEIEKALNTRVNYNYAIDMGGNKYIELADMTLEKVQQRKQVEALWYRYVRNWHKSSEKRLVDCENAIIVRVTMCV